MKKITIMIFVVFIGSLLAQENSSSINDCFISLRRHTRNMPVKISPLNKSNMDLAERRKVRSGTSVDTKKAIEKISDLEVKSIIKKMHNAILADPIEFRRQIVQDDIEVKAARKNGTKNSIAISNFFKSLNPRIEKLHSKRFAKYLKLPLFLKVKITELDNTVYTSNDGTNRKMDQTIISCEVNDIIKGKNYCQIGESLEFYYMDNWKHRNTNFSVGEEYFIILDVITYVDGGHALQLVFESPTEGIFLIESNKLVNENNYFSYGKKIKWEKFKEKFTSDFIDF